MMLTANTATGTDRPRPGTLEDLKATFIRNVNHELRTPLTIAQGYAELLRDGCMGSLAPEQQQALFVITDRIGELRTLVDRVGILLETQARQSILLPLSLNHIIAELAEAQREAATKAGLTLTTCLNWNVPPIRGNGDQLRQALACLVDNAIKFTMTGGHIELQVYTEPGWVCCVVRDTGIGIAQEQLDEILEGFRQGDNSPTRRYRGLGLGMAVVQSVVQSHGGQVQVESQPGCGSQFTLRFPIQPVEANVGLSQTGSDLLSSKRYILVVDDEPNVVSMFQSALKKLVNCEVMTATSGKQALQLFECQAFDLLITDYVMPDMDGIALAKQVRQTYPQTAIVMVTAYANESLRRQAGSISIRRILDKPVETTDVRAAALEALGGT
jgi:CheY-like chemotaxis protein